jgi:hypothetical protein
MPYFGPRDALDDAEMGYQSSAEDPFCLAAAHAAVSNLGFSTKPAVRLISRSQTNGGLGAHSGPSRSNPCKRAFRPIEASKVAVRYVRNTATPAVR